MGFWIFWMFIFDFKNFYSYFNVCRGDIFDLDFVIECCDGWVFWIFNLNFVSDRCMGGDEIVLLEVG